MKHPGRIIISRTDSIGDVVLTLPMAGALKEINPDCKIIFLGRDYTRDVVSLSKHVDEFASWDDVRGLTNQEKVKWIKNLNADAIIYVFPRPDIARISKSAKISVRIGASGRLYHYLNCNKIVPLSRKNSDLHEAQLNFKLLKPFSNRLVLPSIEKIAGYYGIIPNKKPNKKIDKLIDRTRFNLILHPKSKGSAREWPMEHYSELIGLLPKEKFKIFVTGTTEEGQLIKSFLQENKDQMTDLTGRFSLTELIDFIQKCDGLVAASTGPLHLAAALGKLAVGLYPPIQPMHPGRWAPIGQNAYFLVTNKKCSDCRKSLNCRCMNEILPQQVANLIEKNA